jgi:hypothetical protein
VEWDAFSPEPPVLSVEHARALHAEYSIFVQNLGDGTQCSAALKWREPGRFFPQLRGTPLRKPEHNLQPRQLRIGIICLPVQIRAITESGSRFGRTECRLQRAMLSPPHSLSLPQHQAPCILTQFASKGTYLLARGKFYIFIRVQLFQHRVFNPKRTLMCVTGFP